MTGRFAGAERLDGTDRAAVAEFFERHGQFEHLVLAFSPGAVGTRPGPRGQPDDFETAFTGKLFAYLHAIQRAEVTESITMISAASARAALPGTVALAGRQRRDRADRLPAGGGTRAGAGERGLTWHRRYRLVSFLPDDQRQAQFAAAASSVPAGRVAAPADVAGSVSYLVGASMVTGSILPVDGGFTVA